MSSVGASSVADRRASIASIVSNTSRTSRVSSIKPRASRASSVATEQSELASSILSEEDESTIIHRPSAPTLEEEDEDEDDSDQTIISNQLRRESRSQTGLDGKRPGTAGSGGSTSTTLSIRSRNGPGVGNENSVLEELLESDEDEVL